VTANLTHHVRERRLRNAETYLRKVGTSSPLEQIPQVGHQHLEQSGVSVLQNSEGVEEDLRSDESHLNRSRRSVPGAGIEPA
jgi:hypothetical protein